MNPSFLKKYEFRILSGQNGVCFDSFEYEYKLWYNTKVKRPLEKIKHAVAVLPSAYAGGGGGTAYARRGDGRENEGLLYGRGDFKVI